MKVAMSSPTTPSTCAKVLPTQVVETQARPGIWSSMATYWSRTRPWLVMLVLLLVGFAPVLERILNTYTEEEEPDAPDEFDASNHSSIPEEDNDPDDFDNPEEDGDEERQHLFDSGGISPSALLPIHIVMATTMNLIGPFQLNHVFRQRWMGLHRRLGYIYIFCGVGAGLSAILITLINPARYVPLNYVTNLVFGAWLAGSTVAAVMFVRRREIKRHQRWVIRSFGAALTVGVHRVYAVVLHMLPFGGKIEIVALNGSLQDFLLSTIVVLVAEALARRH